MTNDTDIDGDVEIPEAEPLPAIDEAERAAADAPFPAPGEGVVPATDQDDTEGGEPPPLPPMLELAGSNLATAGGLAYGAAGPAGLLAVGAVAAVGTAAYMARNARRNAAERRAGAGAVRGGRTGRLRGLFGPGGRSGRVPGASGMRGFTGHGQSRTGAFGGRRGRAAMGAAGLGGRRGDAWGRGGGSLRGTSARGWGQTGGFRRGFGGSSAAGMRGGSLGRSTGASGLGRGRTASLGRGVGRIGGRTPRWGGSGGARGFGSPARGRGRGRMTSISDPAIPMRGGRPLRGAWGAMRRGWDHPRMRGGRVRVRRASVRTRDYMRKRIRRLKVSAFWQALAGWWGRLWSRVRGDGRYQPMSGASAAASALAVAVLGPSRRASQPRRAITGRVIGTSVRTPGELTARGRLAIGAGTSGAPLEGNIVKKPNEIIRAEAAADELRAALAAFGGADVHMLTYEGGLQALPDMLRTIGKGLHEMSTIAEGEQPLHPAVLQYMHQISAAVHQVADVADELPGLFRAAHETELQRLETPRAGEHRWDASQRDD